MTRTRAILILAGVLALALTLFFGAFWMTSRVCARPPGNAADDLEWLRLEFRLSDADLARIRKLHEGYLPQCETMCARIAEKKAELRAVLAAGRGATAEVEQKLAAVAQLRAQCQANMLRHFQEVSQAMPPEQGRRYLAEMQRITIGQHEGIEASMSGTRGDKHDHH